MSLITIARFPPLALPRSGSQGRSDETIEASQPGLTELPYVRRPIRFLNHVLNEAIALYEPVLQVSNVVRRKIAVAGS